jgi:arabinogalactan oligomer/maltooligosaccharide transport system substrate-binding protein
METEAPMSGTVTLWHGWTEKEIESLNEVIAGFNAMYPGIVVESLFVPFDDLQNKVTTEWGAGEGPTVLIGATDWASAFSAADVIYDMAEVISADVIDGLVDSAVDAVDYDGVLLGLPQTLKGVVMYRNTALMPEAPASLDDIIASGDANLERGFFFSMGHLVTACGGTIANADGTAAFAGATGECWLETLASFPGVEGEYYSDNDVNTMKAGETSVIIDGTWNLSGIVEAIGEDNVAIDPWPAAASGAMSGVVQTESIYIGNLAMDDELAASVAFVEYFLGAEAQSILANPAKAGHIPAVEGLAVEGKFQAQALAAFTGGIAQPRFGGCFWGNLDTALQAFFGGSADAATALADAAAAVDAAVAAGECA